MQTPVLEKGHYVQYGGVPPSESYCNSPLEARPIKRDELAEERESAIIPHPTVGHAESPSFLSRFSLERNHLAPTPE